MAESAYFTAWQMTQNMDLTMRVAASAQQEAEAASLTLDPEEFARTERWDWATQSDWVSAVQAAMATGITEWGRNAGVVTDQMILSWVQANMPVPEP
jgi:hypothetical protein